MTSTRFEEVRRHYQLSELTFTKKLFFLVSLMAQSYMSGNLYDEIIPGLYLSKIPTEEEAKLLKEKIPNLSLVVSVNEDFELNGKILNIDLKLQPPIKWHEVGVKHHQLIATDFTADMAIEDTLKTLKMIHENRQQGGSTVVHCKAGRGRSVTVVVLYLLLCGCKEAGIEPKIDIANLEKSDVVKKDIQALYEFVRKKRPQVNLKEHNFDKISEVMTATAKNGFSLEPKTHSWSTADKPSLKKRLNEFLSSLDSKEEIAQFTAFKHLKFYAIDNDNTNRKRIIQNFLDDIFYADNAGWYFSLFNQEGPCQQLLDARPMNGLFGQGKPIRRATIVENFKKELTDALCSTLKCEADDLECLVDMYRCQQLYPALKKA